MLLICGKSSIFFANKKVFGQKFADFKIMQLPRSSSGPVA